MSFGSLCPDLVTILLQIFWGECVLNNSFNPYCPLRKKCPSTNSSFVRSIQILPDIPRCQVFFKGLLSQLIWRHILQMTPLSLIIHLSNCRGAKEGH